MAGFFFTPYRPGCNPSTSSGYVTYILQLLTSSAYAYWQAQERSRNAGYRWLGWYVNTAASITPLFRPIVWLVIACSCFAFARRCRPAARRFVEALSLSSLIYLLTYLLVGVASDFRYAYWAVCATSVCAVVLMAEGAAALRPRAKQI